MSVGQLIVGGGKVGEDSLCRPEGEVQTGADKGAHADVDPEEGFEDAEEPVARVGSAVLGYGDKNCGRAVGGISMR